MKAWSITMLERAKEVIRKEAAAVAQLEGKLNESFALAVECLLACKGRVIVIGIGKSGIIGKKIAATFNSVGTPAMFLHPVESLHGDLGLVCRDDVVIAVSKSGDTDELAQIFPTFKRIGVKIITITGKTDSTLAQQSDIVLDASVPGEAGSDNLIPTSSTTAALVMGDALAMVLLQERNFTAEDFALLHPGGDIGRKLLKVGELMHRDGEIPRVRADTGMKDSILEMTSKRLGVTTVVDEEGRLLGVVTDGDLRRLLESGRDFTELTAGEVMTPRPKTIHADSLAVKALNMMETHKITSLPVVERGDIVIGILHLHDLLQAKVM